MSDPFLYQFVCEVEESNDDYLILKPLIGSPIIAIPRVQDEMGRPIDGAPEEGAEVTVTITKGGLKTVDVSRLGRKN